MPPHPSPANSLVSVLRQVILVAFIIAASRCATSYGIDHLLVLPGNMKVLDCEMPSAESGLVGSSAPGHVFFAGEAVNLQLRIARNSHIGPTLLTLRIQEITTRDPEAKVDGGFTDTAGQAPRIGLEGTGISFPFQVAFAEGQFAIVQLTAVPVPNRFGTYALILIDGCRKQFLGTVARVPSPVPGGNFDNTPVLGESVFLERHDLYPVRAATYNRIGVHGMRMELSWGERPDGTCDWSQTDAAFAACEANQLQLMVTLGGHPTWTWPFGPQQQTPAAVRPSWDGSPYGGQSDWLCDPKYYPRFAIWVKALCKRYWKDGKGGLWGLEDYNEPWEGGGISGWARDALQYREIQKLIAFAARSVDVRIKLCAASSIMNTEDKFFSDGSREFDRYLDVFTDHYVKPAWCYGPLVAVAHGKESMETETWFVNSEYLLPQIVQFLATGQKRVTPWHPRALFDSLPGSNEQYLIPTPLVSATAAFNHFVTGKPFEKLVFHHHLPWLFQFGHNDDPNGLLIVMGQLMTIGGKNDPRERLWAQVDGSGGGTLTLNNSDNLLRFYDLAGNPTFVGQKEVVLPMTIYPTYITCEIGPAAAAERIRAAKISGKRPVEILPHDFGMRVGGNPTVLAVITVHNCMNQPIKGELEVLPASFLEFADAKQPVLLAAGESKDLTFVTSSAKPDDQNNYPCSFRFVSDAGSADYAEVMHAAIAPKGTKRIDGNLDDWQDAPGVLVAAGSETPEATERLRRPWLERGNLRLEGRFAEFKVAWDDNFLYFAARVNGQGTRHDSPPMAGRDENAYFHTAKDDDVSPYREFLKQFPGRSFAEVPYVYAQSPEMPRRPDLPVIHFRRDRIQIAIDCVDGWHDLPPDTDRVPIGFHAVPDTDYEYALYPCAGGTSELWRLLAPGVPRRHDFPRTAQGPRTTGLVPGAKYVVKREGDTCVYEAAIPREELAQLRLAPGTTFGLMLRAGYADGPNIDLGNDKAVTKVNGLTLHPYWERSNSCSLRWTLVN